MSRYKGRANTKAIEQAYPHIVEMIVPLGGFGRKLDDMYEWHRGRGIRINADAAGATRMAMITFRWCFANVITAQDFARKFGGSYFLRPDRRRRIGQCRVRSNIS